MRTPLPTGDAVSNKTMPTQVSTDRKPLRRKPRSAVRHIRKKERIVD